MWDGITCPFPDFNSQVATRQGNVTEKYFFKVRELSGNSKKCQRNSEKEQMSGKCQGITAGVVRGNPDSAVLAICEGISNCIPRFTWHVINHSC